jgi:SAM-dependent methyltransferase
MSHHAWDADHGRHIQDRQNRLAAVAESKERTVELLATHRPVVDVGCGTGEGTVALGDAAIGVDSSPAMLGIAKGRSATVVQGDATALPLRTASFGGARFDRVLYHLSEPEVALAEAARLLRPGGRIVCAHPDNESIELEVPGAREDLIALTKRTRVELNYVNGTVVRRIPNLLLSAGFVDVDTEVFTLVVDDPDEPAFAVPAWLRNWTERGDVDLSSSDLDEWDEAIEKARRRGSYRFTLPYLVTHALRR